MNFAISLDNNYVMPCLALVTSLLENNKKNDCHIFLLTDGLTEDNVGKFRRLSEIYQQTIDIKIIPQALYLSLPFYKRYTFATYNRFMIADLIEDSKVIYLDGDIIVISHGAEYADPIIKRVIATEGQTLSIDFDKGYVYVDGKKIDEPYIQGFTHAEDAEIPKIIPKGKVFVMGDNRGVSLDSRSKEIGLIDVNDIIGKAQVVVFPFNSIKYLY